MHRSEPMLQNALDGDGSKATSGDDVTVLRDRIAVLERQVNQPAITTSEVAVQTDDVERNMTVERALLYEREKNSLQQAELLEKQLATAAQVEALRGQLEQRSSELVAVKSALLRMQAAETVDEIVGAVIDRVVSRGEELQHVRERAEAAAPIDRKPVSSHLPALTMPHTGGG